MKPHTPSKKNIEPLQPSGNGKSEKPLKKPLQRFNTLHLDPTEWEKRVKQCEKNLHYLEKLGWMWPKRDVNLLTIFYRDRLIHYQNKIDTANAWLIEVSSPTIL